VTRRMALALQGRAAPRELANGSDGPRTHLFDDLFVARYDDAVLDSRPPTRLTSSVPSWARIAAEVRRRSSEYDVVVSWSERVTLSLMTMDGVLGAAKPHVALMYWFSRPSVRWPIRLFGRSLHAIVTWSSVQRAYAIERLGIMPEKIYLVRHYVDQVFWRPEEALSDMICSAGAEMRDYPTLLAALRGTNVRCHIASDHVRVDRFGFAQRRPIEALTSKAGPNVTLGRRSRKELRDLYARSRFVVVPLEASDTDNGITVILEAMAMGKPVICSRTKGQVDVIEEGVTGLFVPAGDAVALREAILALWNDPERARAMGQAARDYVAKHHALDTFCRDVKRAIDASLDGTPAAVDGSCASARPHPT
jgi:glycosyltransferase involved in cell wall biosynthesis